MRGPQTGFASLVADLAAEQATLDGLITPEVLDRPTVAEGWSIADTVAHLLLGDRSALVAVTDPDAFADLRRAGRAAGGDRWSPAPAERSALLDTWRETRRLLQAALSGLEPDARVGWFGPSMSARSFVTARLMECWAHGEDVALALGRALPATDRLRHVCHLGVLTRGFSFAVHGSVLPAGDVFVDLTSPGGRRWSWGQPDAAEVVRGPARDFCLVVTQRRHLEDTALEVRGEAASRWMRQAQAFAGPPTVTAPGRRGLPSAHAATPPSTARSWSGLIPQRSE